MALERFFFSSRRRHTRCSRDWSSDVCSSERMIRHTRCSRDWSSDVCSSDLNRSRWYWWRGRIEVIAGPVKFVPRSTPGAEPRFNYPVQDTTYRAHDAIEVRMHDVSRVGAVLDTALGRGITDISEVRFSATDVSAPQVEALREATVRARKQAEAIAAAGGLQLGRVLSLNTEADYASRYGWDDFALRGVTVSTAGTVE